jgi:hypothetical protein
VNQAFKVKSAKAIQAKLVKSVARQMYLNLITNANAFGMAEHSWLKPIVLSPGA